MPPPNETKRKRKTTELTIPRNEPGYILGYGKEAYDKKNYTLYDLKSAYIEHADDDEDTAHLKGDVYKYMGGSKCKLSSDRNLYFFSGSRDTTLQNLREPC